MASFLQRFVWEIVYGEEPELSKEWCMDIVALQDLVSRQVLEELSRCFSGFGDRAYKLRLQSAYCDPRAETIMRYIMQAQHYPLLNHQRRRAPLMLEGPAEYLRDRSLSVGHPRWHHRRRRQVQIAYLWAQQNGYFDEFGKMQYLQEEMNMKIDHIERKLYFLF
ncbi:hypothetical protein G6011_00386 [Alternaria panax]|uniref:Uncharacterized protein n=1 Tax=Alternaria panax TaxID=48097 RepID=A0AAD4II21_9PLEO|nr:hypothetical protein G6011_00386 [Alternaria panax]